MTTFEVGQKYSCQGCSPIYECVSVVECPVYGPFVILKSAENNSRLLAEYEQDLTRENYWKQHGPFTWVKVLSCHVHKLKRDQYVLAEKPDE